MPTNYQLAKTSHIRTKYKLQIQSKRLHGQPSKFSYNWFFSEPTHNFLDHPSNQEASPQGQTHCTVSVTCVLPRETTRLHTLYL